jgi:hypothetical protein
VLRLVRFYCLALFLWWFVTDDGASCSALGIEGGSSSLLKR